MQRGQVDPRQIEFRVTQREEASSKSKTEDKKVKGKKERGEKESDRNNNQK